MRERRIIERCIQKDRKAQKTLYERYSPSMLGICVRYAKNLAEAEDVLQEAFVKVFLNIHKFEGKGAIENWIRRIVINTAITHYHQNQKHRFHQDIDDIAESTIKDMSFDTCDFTQEELLGVIKSLPPGYRMVFNLFAIEGYKHKDIGKMLEIDEKTSRSQYSRARKLVQRKLTVLSAVARKT